MLIGMDRWEGVPALPGRGARRERRARRPPGWAETALLGRYDRPSGPVPGRTRLLGLFGEGRQGYSAPESAPAGCLSGECRLKALVHWWRKPRPHEVLVVIASPGDCTKERAEATAVISLLNRRPAVARSAVRCRPVLWEN